MVLLFAEMALFRFLKKQKNTTFKKSTLLLLPMTIINVTEEILTKKQGPLIIRLLHAFFPDEYEASSLGEIVDHFAEHTPRGKMLYGMRANMQLEGYLLRLLTEKEARKMRPLPHTEALTYWRRSYPHYACITDRVTTLNVALPYFNERSFPKLRERMGLSERFETVIPKMFLWYKQFEDGSNWYYVSGMRKSLSPHYHGKSLRADSGNRTHVWGTLAPQPV